MQRDPSTKSAAGSSATSRPPIARSQATDPGYLKGLAHEINVRLQKADDHRLSAALKLAEAKVVCKKAGIPFKSWVSREIKLTYNESTILARIGASDDPPKALADLRQGTKTRTQKQREKVLSRDNTLADARAAYVAVLNKQPKKARAEEVLVLMRMLKVGIHDLGVIFNLSYKGKKA